jgi:hypothetical protein
MANLKVFASLVLAVTAASTLSAKALCHGNAARLPLRVVNRHQMIVAVSINHGGPYNFLLDTGAQMTMLHPSLASSLRLSTGGTAEVASAGVNASASFAQVALIEAGSQSSANQKVLVYNLRNLPATGLNIQGVLGEDFLEQFDILIDNAHGVLSVDEPGAMQPPVKGQRVPLLEPGEKGAQLADSLIGSARLTDGTRPIRLKLDSGANAPFLYRSADYMALGLFHGTAVRGSGPNGAQRKFAALPAQDVKIGALGISKVTFITIPGARKDSRTSNFDGLLPIGLFKQVFISHANHFAVLEAW